MGFFERVQTAMAVLRGLPPIDLPASGRSSDESLSGSMSSYLTSFGSVNPVIDFEQLKTLKCLWIHNPDFSQYVANIVNLGNPGHQLTVDAANDAGAEAVVARLNEAASRIYVHGGADGLIDQYLTSLSWSGAISSEDVVNLAARRVEKVVIVPVEQIRFRYNKETDAYDAYQKTNNPLRQGADLGLLKLNPETYKYAAFLTVENSPYAKPPATAAIEPILESQKPIMDNIRWIAKKFGILGLVAMGIAPIKQKSGETDDEYRQRFQDHIKNYTDAMSGNFNKGLIVYPKPNSIETTNVTPGAAGLEEVNKVSEQQVFSGMGAQPGFHGRTDSTTETFADVVYYLLVAQMTKLQRVAKRRMEATYRLDLRLAGIDVADVSLQFNKAHSRNAKEEAETEQLRQTAVFERVTKGLISADEGAQELGYESWDDVTALDSQGSLDGLGSLGRMMLQKRKTESGNRKTVKLSFDKNLQRYTYRPEVLRLAGGSPAFRRGEKAAEVLQGGNVVPIKKKKVRV